MDLTASVILHLRIVGAVYRLIECVKVDILLHESSAKSNQ